MTEYSLEIEGLVRRKQELEAEIARLRNTERLQAINLREATAEIERLQGVVVSGDREIKASHADCDRYRAEIEWLTAVLREIINDPSTYSAEPAKQIARAALEGK